jgi:plasmid stabilization system protein ParE
METASRIEPEILGALASFDTLYQYMVVYRAGAPLEIIAVLHAKRNVKRLLNQRL